MERSTNRYIRSQHRPEGTAPMIYESAAPTTPVDSVNATRRMALTIGGLGAAGVTLGACG